MVAIVELDASDAIEGDSVASADIVALLANQNLPVLLDLVGDSMAEHDAQLVGDRLVEWLDFEPQEWNWRSHAISKDKEEKLCLRLRLAVVLFSKVDGVLQYRLMKVISYYMNEHTPWSTHSVAVEARKINVDDCVQHMRQFVDDLKPDLLKLAASKVSLAGYAKPKKVSALRPSLGFGGEEKGCSEWKHSSAVKSISSISLLVEVGLAWSDYGHYWPLASTFILNVLDDSDPLFRAQGCFLLSDFIPLNGSRLSKNGLDVAFKESVEVCLTYLPKLTPANVSLHVLKAAYPAVFQILDLQNASYRSYLDILEKNILSLISHVQGRDNDADTVLVLIFLMDQLRYVVSEHVKSAVLASFSRINFVVSQLLINPYIVEFENGPQLVDSALKVHGAILQIFSKLDDQDALNIVLLYKYDLLAAWTVLCKRVVKYNVGTAYTGELIEQNASILKIIAVSSGLGQEFHDDLDSIWTSAPETKTYVH